MVNLAWQQGGGDWVTVPTEHLVIDPTAIPNAPTASVPAPATLGALLAGAIALAANSRRQRNRRT